MTTNEPALPSIDPGGYVLVMRCPACRNPSEVFITVATRLTVDASGASLRPAFHGTAVEHRCGQASLIDHPPTDDVGTVAMFSGRDRAAGEHLDR
jgi:hypothetical protein